MPDRWIHQSLHLWFRPFLRAKHQKDDKDHYSYNDKRNRSVVKQTRAPLYLRLIKDKIAVAVNHIAIYLPIGLSFPDEISNCVAQINTNLRVGIEQILVLTFWASILLDQTKVTLTLNIVLEMHDFLQRRLCLGSNWLNA